MLDDYAAEIFADNINMMVPWYLMAAYAYYKKDEPILSDAFFDAMGKTMLERWDDIDHFHKHFITVDDLEFLRPCPRNALPPHLIQKIVGATLYRSIKAGDCFLLNDLGAGC